MDGPDRGQGLHQHRPLTGEDCQLHAEHQLAARGCGRDPGSPGMVSWVEAQGLTGRPYDWSGGSSRSSWKMTDRDGNWVSRNTAGAEVLGLRQEKLMG